MYKRLLCLAFLIILILAFILTVTGCNNKDDIKVGFSVCLTGRSSELGVSGRNGAEIAVDNINKSGGIKGRKVQLVIKDDGEKPETAVRVDNEFAAEGVVAIIGHLTSGTAVASLPLAKEKNILFISPTVSSENLTGQDDNFIRVIASNKYQGELLAETAFNINKNRKIAAVYEWTNRAYTEELFKHFRNKFEELGGSIVFTTHFVSGSNVSFAEVARQMVDSGADGMVVIASGTDAAVICQHLQRIKPKVPVYSGMWAMTEDLILHGGKAVENQYMPGVFDKDSSKPEYIKFKEQYYEKYQSQPTFASIYCYDAAMVLFDALKYCDNFDTKSIKESVLKLREFDGLQDSFFIDEYGDTDRSYSLFTVINGQFKKVK